MHTAQVVTLTKQIRAQNIDIDTTSLTTMIRANPELSKIKIMVQSSCKNIKVYMLANGTLSDVLIEEEVLDRYTSHELAAIIMQTIKEAESVIQSAIESIMNKNRSSS